MRWLLLDRIRSIQKGAFAETEGCIPESLIASPEVLLLEMMAQTGGLLVGAECDFRDDVIFAKIESAHFSSLLIQEKSILIRAESENLKPEGAWVDGVVFSQTQEVARARLLLMNVGRLKPESEKSITFHKAFMDHFKVRSFLMS